MEDLAKIDYKSIGIKVFKPFDYLIIKEKPEFFIVEEIIDGVKKGNNFLTVKILKKGISHFNLIERLRKYGKVYYCGIKDKDSLALQYFSIELKNKDDVKKIMKEFKVISHFFSENHVKHKILRRNRFISLVKCSSRVLSKILENCEEVLKRGFPNFYGHQRFGKNLDVALSLLEKDYEKALFYIIPENLRHLYPNLVEIYKKIDKRENFYESMIIRELIRGKSLENSFKKIPKNIYRIIFSSLQSLVFNITLSEAILNEMKIPHKIQLIGKNFKVKNELDKVSYNVCMERNINVKNLPLKRSYRISFSYPFKLKIKKIGKKEIIVKSELIRGSYQTILLSSLAFYKF